MRPLVIACALLMAVLPAPAVAQIQVGRGCAPGQNPFFRDGFAVLADRLGAAEMGYPLTCEFADVNGTGDVLQLTSRGLAFWRKQTNTPTFTDGNIHYALTARSRLGYVYWYGPSIDPPADAELPQGAPEFACAAFGPGPLCDAAEGS